MFRALKLPTPGARSSTALLDLIYFVLRQILSLQAAAQHQGAARTSSPKPPCDPGTCWAVGAGYGVRRAGQAQRGIFPHPITGDESSAPPGCSLLSANRKE